MYKLTEKKTNTLNLYFNDYQYSYKEYKSGPDLTSQ